MRTPKKPERVKVRSGFMPLESGNAAGVRAHPQSHSPLPGNSTGSNSGYQYKLNLAGVGKRGRRMF